MIESYHEFNMTKYKTTIIIAKIGILWFFIMIGYIMKGILKNKHNGITITLIITNIAKIKSQYVYEIFKWNISYKYINNNPNEHINVNVNIIFGRKPFICLSIKYFVTM